MHSTTTRRRGLLGLVVLALIAGLALPAHAALDPQLDVTSVTDRDVVLTMTLPVTQDSLADAGEPSGVVSIGERDLPTQAAWVQQPVALDQMVVLVADASGSMADGRIEDARRAAEVYLDALPQAVSVGLVTFSDEVRSVVSPGADRAEISEALAEITPDGDTRLYDAVVTAAGLVPYGVEGRLLVLSDGQDTTSAATLVQAVKAATNAGVSVDVVAIDPTAEERMVAERLTSRTAGTMTQASTAGELVDAFSAAASAFDPRVLLRATVPDDINASGARVDARVTVDDTTFVASTALPDLASLATAVIDAPNPYEAGEAAPPSSPPGPASEDQVTPAAVPAPTPNPLVVGLLAGLGALAIGLLAVSTLRYREVRARRRRIDAVMHYAEATSGRGGTAQAAAELAARQAAPLEQTLIDTRYGKRMIAAFAAANMTVTVTKWLALQVISLLAAWLVVGLLVRSIVVGLLLALVLVPLAFEAYLSGRVSRRRNAFSDELPEFLLMLSSAIRAGQSFPQALESSAHENRGEVGRQMRRVLAEAQLTSRLDDALLACAGRMHNDDLRWTVTALAIQREVGGNLSKILDSAAETIKGRHAIAREVRTLSAEGRLSAYVLLALPLGVFAFLFLFRREYISRLWTDPLGLLMLGVLVVLMVIGWMWMRSIVRIKV